MTDPVRAGSQLFTYSMGMNRTMRRLVLLASAAALGFVPTARAQAVPGGPAVESYRVSDYFAAPGMYGTSYGFNSYGVPRTYTSFSAKPWSPYYANYPAAGYMPGRYGVGLWRPGFTAPGYVYGAPTGAGSYRTFPVTAGTGLTPQQIAPPPPIGAYAPGFGPGVGLYGE